MSGDSTDNTRKDLLLTELAVRLVLDCVAEQREFETGLKKRKREFGETLERYEAEVDKYAQRSELSKRDELAAQVSELSQRLKEVRNTPCLLINLALRFAVTGPAYGNAHGCHSCQNQQP